LELPLHRTALQPRIPKWLQYVSASGARCGFTEQASFGAADTDLGGFLRGFHGTTLPRWQVRHARPDNYEEVAVLFKAVFSHKLRNWKYVDGHDQAVVAERDSALIAYIGVLASLKINGG
jgi:hypothetical protein